MQKSSTRSSLGSQHEINSGDVETIAEGSEGNRSLTTACLQTCWYMTREIDCAQSADPAGWSVDQ